ncbi:MAG: hypothetical protein EU981_04435 [Candidatus Liberibacter ctenarytainae]|uniref:Uncharacterized protein n=1 Tax=Candidatus Liberibacter ctenarytainae TaxID=2020335 RepID=A0A937AKV9_9HYPH|nr:hypothetical protein [Candidatus Liberibacter ctenarytainae]
MIFFPTVYRLIPHSKSQDCSLCDLQMISSKEKFILYLPCSGHDNTGYWLFTSFFKKWNFHSNNLIVQRIDFFLGCFLWVWHWFTLGRHKKLCYGDNRVYAYGSKKAKRYFSKSNAHMRKRGLDFDGQKIGRFPRLLYGWNDFIPEKTGVSVAIKARVSIVVHLYYIDLWQEISNLLSGLEFSFDLYVTLVQGSISIQEEILQRFPDARIHVVDNYGRDIGPFLVLLETGQLDSYDYICKIHGKKSQRKNHPWWEGDLWRRWLFFDLLGAPGIALKIIDTFDRYKQIGMIGSRAYRYPNRYFGKKHSLGNNHASICSIASRMGIAFKDQNLDFFAGTMFWIRREALDPMILLELSKDCVPEAQIDNFDGGCEHAIERCFSLSVTRAGFNIGDVDCVLEESIDRTDPQISISTL